MTVSANQEWTEEVGAETVVSPARPLYTLPLIPGRGRLAQTLAGPGLEGLALRTLYGSGIRPAELLALTADHLGEPRQIALPDRFAPVEAELWGELKQLSGRFFPWSESELEVIFTEAAERSGLGARFAACGRRLLPQTLRHAYATHRLEQGMNLATLCFILGHASEETTAQYLRTAVALRGAGYASAHPLMKGQPPLPQWGNDIPGFEGAEQEDGLEPMERTHPATPTEEETWQLLLAADKARDVAMLRLFYASGMRAAEMIARILADIEVEECRVFVRNGKESKDRYCLVDAHTLSLLQLDGPPDQSLFGLHTYLTIETMVNRLASKTGLDGVYAARGQHLSPHSFRHAFATHLYCRGLELFSLKRLLGHDNLVSTLIYTQVPVGYLQAAYSRCHPLEVGK